MPHCTKCGTEVAATAQFCPTCGQPQSAMPPVGSPPPPVSGGGITENTAAALSYVLGWITGVIFFLIDKRPYVRFRRGAVDRDLRPAASHPHRAGHDLRCRRPLRRPWTLGIRDVGWLRHRVRFAWRVRLLYLYPLAGVHHQSCNGLALRTDPFQAPSRRRSRIRKARRGPESVVHAWRYGPACYDANRTGSPQQGLSWWPSVA